MDDTLHIYGPACPHDDTYIVGTSGAILALRDALTAALEHGTASTAYFTNDGEGANVEVRVRTPEQVDKLTLPYSDTDNVRHEAGMFAPEYI